MAGLLGHIRVLDFTQFLSGPYCTQILGDLGAEVIKIEPPEGDSSRTVPPHFVADDSAYFLAINRNKRSIVIDLRRPEGRDLALALAARADVVVENFRPGVMARLGLGYEALAAQNKALVLCSISGFGQDGPYRDRPAYDMIVQAMSGGMSLTGLADGPPVRMGVPIGDLSAGLYGAIGILAALQRREREGKGSVVDVSMLDCQVAMLCYQAAYHLQAGVVPGPQGRGHDSIPTYRCFTARDGREVAITANTERMWRGLCTELDLTALIDDPRFATMADRNRHRAALEPLLEEGFRARDADDWTARLLAVGVPAATVNTVDRALADPQVQHRGMVLDMAGPEGRQARVAGNPIKVAGADAPARYPAPLGSDARAVLTDLLGFDEARIAALLRDGVVAERPTGARAR
jgi:crotonobetainyl-CoA:carnitine CoA-transferase CaiB-like acyl-CoA transferase